MLDKRIWKTYCINWERLHNFIINRIHRTGSADMQQAVVSAGLQQTAGTEDIQWTYSRIGGLEMGFEGFSKEALKFLFENRMNNSKEWYEEHKPEYRKYVYEPFAELVKELEPAIKEIDESIITVPSKIISRVRRDTRFTKDKSLYRDNAWIVFLRDKTRMSATPCFWFELGQNGISYGVGYYSAQSASMARMREMILGRHPSFMAALKAYESQNEFVIGGESYKKCKYPDQPENIKQWLIRKNIYFENVHRDYRPAFSRELPEVLINGFRKLKPMYDFMLLVESSA